MLLLSKFGPANRQPVAKALTVVFYHAVWTLGGFSRCDAISARLLSTQRHLRGFAEVCHLTRKV